MPCLDIFFEANSLALGQLCDYPKAREVTLKYMGKINKQENPTKPYRSVEVLGYTVKHRLRQAREMYTVG